ncbi:AI-2E family transporter [Sinorhizobium alkalisoli]|uniref:AI-2E family transporter n=1 Tax=Sinorhizobium alkalisoli TaxID=1752398 RepID=UPI00124D96A3|nr:AI-2E family transporter [Sinorhizobium alkalisoli]
MSANPRPTDFSVRPVLVGAALVVGGLLIWELRHFLMLVFAAVLLAIALSAFSQFIRTWLGTGWNLSLFVSAAVIVAAIAGFSFLLGSQIGGEITQLAERAPELAVSAGNWLGLEDPLEWLEQQARGVFRNFSLLSGISGLSTVIYSSLVETLLVVAGAIYLAARPRSYREGFLKLLPGRWRNRAGKTIASAEDALRVWLLGQFLAMAAVGLATTLGLLALGIPSAVALGFLAGVLEFVPYVGPVLSAVPAVALGLVEGPTKALLVFALYFAIQQAEGLLLAPLIQRKAVDLAPALAIFAIVAFGIVLGPMGVVLAAPLTVLSVVLVKTLWLREDDDRSRAEAPSEQAELERSAGS